MTEIEQKSIKAQLEIANELVSEMGQLLSFLRIEAGIAFSKASPKEPQLLFDFVAKFKDEQKVGEISTLCKEYAQKIEMKRIILNKFR